MAPFKKGQLTLKTNKQTNKPGSLTKVELVTAELSRAHNSEGDMSFQTQNYYKRAPELVENLAVCTKGPTQPQEPLKPWNHSFMEFYSYSPNSPSHCNETTTGLWMDV